MNEQGNGRAGSLSEEATAILLIAHGSRQEAANQDLAELVERVAASTAYPIVVGCFLELLAHPATDGVPFILETPGSRDPGSDQISLIKALRA